MGGVHGILCFDFCIWSDIREFHLFSVLMRVFLKRVFGFTLLMLLLAILADLCVSRGLRKTERGHFYTMNALMNTRMDADIVILGNSRAAGSYHPFVLDSILHVNSRNLGVSGQPFGVSWLRWELYRRKNSLPKLLIINMDYDELRMISNGFEREQYYPYMSDTLVKPYLDLYGFSWADRHIPMYRYRGDYKLIGIGLTELFGIRHDKKGNYYKGYSNPNEPWDGKRLENKLKNGDVKGSSDGQAVALLEKVLKQSVDDGFQVVFVYAPLYERLKKHLDEYGTLQVYQDLSQRYHAPILDFSQMGICSDSTYFRDANHLNSEGALLFTTALGHAIDSLIVL